MASGKDMENQFHKWNNSNLADRGATTAARGVIALAGGIAIVVFGASLAMPPPLSGRLHPGHVPAAIAIIGLAAAFTCFLKPPRSGSSRDASCLAMAPAPARAIACAVAAVVIMALGVRSAGVLPTVFAAGCVAALGVRGVGVAKACAIGAALSAVAALSFVVLLRQPLPLLPDVRMTGPALPGFW